ncbi:MAG: hypothetical protein KKA07_09290 [Bacteroidetes bacterium]|nr:hypothetical protein [Bacteroidota bacterium]MBU1719255.1 hypothetical protein [Bacteroidota bacterium]
MKNSVILLFSCLCLLSCKKDKDIIDDEIIDNTTHPTLTTFVSLVAERDTIFLGETTQITATVEGTEVTFAWSATAGDILGSGNQVVYNAPPCTPGANKVTCTAAGENRSESKEITITVF